MDRATRNPAGSFDHLIGGAEEGWWYGDAERLCGFEIDHQFELGGLLDRKVGRISAFQNAADILARLISHLIKVRSITDQAAEAGKVPHIVHSGDTKEGPQH